MRKREQKRPKFPRNAKPTHINQDIAGILLIALALFIFVSTSSSSSGLMGLYLVKKFLKPAIGIGVYFLPYFVGLFGVIMMLRQQSLLLTIQICGILLLFFTLISYGEGGYVAYVIRGGLEGIFGQVGSYIALSSFFLISIILIFNFTITKALYAFVDFLMKKRPKTKAKPVRVEQDRRSIPSMIPVIKEITEANQQFVDEMKRTEHTPKPRPVTYQPPKKIGKYTLPPLTLLDEMTEKDKQREEKFKETIELRKRALEETLRSFGIEASVVAIAQGPAVTRFEVQPEAGIKVSKIAALADDIAMNLASHGVRIEAPIPGKAAVGIEVPNPAVIPVRLGEIARSEDFQKHSSKLLIALGKDLSGAPIFGDLAKMPHLLIAGTTGSGKSVCINTLIMSLLMRARPDEVKFLMIDPKMVEFTHYNDIPHLLAPVVTDAKKASRTLKEWALKEMDRRYKSFFAAGVRNVDAFNEKADRTQKMERMPYIVIIIDELADMMMVAANEVETTICRIAQMARATGIHLVVATQRPSVDVITGLIKANIPSRISFAVATQVDSRVILDMSGAEKLLGKGDMLYHPIGAMKPFRLQGAFVTDREVEDVTGFIKKQAEPQFSQEIIDIEQAAEVAGDSGGRDGGRDDLFAEAAKIIITGGQASTSHLQRRLRIGYNRAARLMDEMEAAGIVGHLENDNKPRKITASADTLKNLGIN
jgi:DNA segregation ATPase FtsK/SpoIIIE, S-DNA-T family